MLRAWSGHVVSISPRTQRDLRKISKNAGPTLSTFAGSHQAPDKQQHGYYHIPNIWQLHHKLTHTKILTPFLNVLLLSHSSIHLPQGFPGAYTPSGVVGYEKPHKTNNSDEAQRIYFKKFFRKYKRTGMGMKDSEPSEQLSDFGCDERRIMSPPRIEGPRLQKQSKSNRTGPSPHHHSHTRTLQQEEVRGSKMAVQIPKKGKFVADGIFKAKLNEFLTQELAKDGYSGVEVQLTPTRTEIIILATSTQKVLGEKGHESVN
ncbi:hypothetical protein HPG69_002443 [Diceros bicornis minor]|uniref:Ribosomal protein S3 n=1 Tax=Diceros bicornis minor TaxID=77932 RepID=A0A7J7FNR5_DICBM|nr:hypothetical protein HPG69_002443 [Diceros bicornis minor]